MGETSARRAETLHVIGSLDIFILFFGQQFQLSQLRSNPLNQLLPLPKNDFQQFNHVVIQALTLSALLKVILKEVRL